MLHELSRAVTGQLDQAGILLETVHQQLAPAPRRPPPGQRCSATRRPTGSTWCCASMDGRPVRRGRAAILSRSSEERGLATIVLESGRRDPDRRTTSASAARRGADAGRPTTRTCRTVLGVPMTAGEPRARRSSLLRSRGPRAHRGRTSDSSRHRPSRRPRAPQRAPLRGRAPGLSASSRRPGPARAHREAARPRRDGLGSGARLQQRPGRDPRAARSSCSARVQTPSCASGSTSSSARRSTAPARCAGCRSSRGSAATSRRSPST